MSVGAEGGTADFILEESGVVVRAERIAPNRQTLNLGGRIVALALSLLRGNFAYLTQWRDLNLSGYSS